MKLNCQKYKEVVFRPSYYGCANWEIYQKNVSIVLVNIIAEEYYALGFWFERNLNPCCAV